MNIFVCFYLERRLLDALVDLILVLQCLLSNKLK